MKRIFKGVWDQLEIVLMVIFLDAFMINVFLQIITRMLFNMPLSFTEEVSRYLFIWMVFLAMPYSTKYEKHIAMDVFTKHLPKSVQFALKIIIHLITIGVFGWVFYYGMGYLSMSKMVKTPVLQISKAVVAAIIPITGILMIIRSVERLLLDCRIFMGIAGESGGKSV